MTIFESMIAAVASVSLTVAVVYAFWLKVRASMLKTELLELCVELRQKAKVNSDLNDPAYKAAVSGLLTLSKHAKRFSLPYMACLHYYASRQEKISGWPKSDNPEFQIIVDSIVVRACRIIGHHVCYRTVTGGISLLLIKSIPQSIETLYNGLEDIMALGKLVVT